MIRQEKHDAKTCEFEGDRMELWREIVLWAFFREVKERIAAETAGMTFEQLKRYISERAARGSREKFEPAPEAK